MVRLSKKKYFYYVGLLLLIIIATVISSKYSRDSVSYQNFFNYYGASGWEGFATEIYLRELFFLITSKVIYSLGIGSIFLFAIYSTISLCVKFYLIYNLSKDRLLSSAFFISYFFILHDSTQIRFGIAIAFVYLGMYFLSESKKLLFSALVIFSAIMFHTVSLVFLVMLFFTTKKSLLWLFGMVAIAVVLYPVNLNMFMLDFIEGVLKYFDLPWNRLTTMYSLMLNPSSDAFLGIFSRSALLVYLCAIVIYQYRDKFSPYEILCYNAFILSIFFYILLKDTVDLQVRIRDLFGFSLVFLIPYIYRGMSFFIGGRNAYILLYLYLGVHLIKFAIYDKMLLL